MNDKYEKIIKLAAETIRYSRNSLLVDLRFLDLSLSMLTPVPYEGTITTDGEHLFYDPVYILKLYQQQPTLLNRAVLHSLLHCVFRHNIVSTLVDKKAWGLACDIDTTSTPPASDDIPYWELWQDQWHDVDFIGIKESWLNR